ncbi:MAG: hypothetical protein ACK58N_19100, partial [Synechocystis sp.]
EMPNIITDFTQGTDVIGVAAQGSGVNFDSLGRDGNNLSLNGTIFATLLGVNTELLTAADLVFA